MDGRPATGSEGEDAAAHVYEARGYAVIARNWRCRVGELDLVLARGDLLVVCEVKTRRDTRFGGGFESVTARKRAKLRTVAEAFLLQDPRRCPGAIRFDVASVSANGRRFDVELFEDAF